MAPKDYKVDNIHEFLQVVEECTNEWFIQEKTWGPWFRGHRDARWKLRPSLYRYPPCARPIRRLEDEIRQEFIVRAPSLGPERPQSSWEWYFLMQHCGAPTRLLDWTESALIALYFAVRDKSDQADSAVWVLEPWKLNTHVADLNEVIAPAARNGCRIGIRNHESFKERCRWRCTQHTFHGGSVRNDPASPYMVPIMTASTIFLSPPSHSCERSSFRAQRLTRSKEVLP